MPQRLLKRLRKVVTGRTALRLRYMWSAELTSIVATLVSGLVVARALGAFEYGRFALLLAVAGLVCGFVDPRAGEVATKYLGTAVSRAQSHDALLAFRVSVVLDIFALVAAVAAVAATVIFLPWLNAATLPESLLAAFGVAFVAPATTARAVLAVLGEYRVLSLHHGVMSVARALATASAAVATRSVGPVLVALAAVAAVEASVGLLLCRQRVRRTYGRLPGDMRALAATRAALPGLGRFVVYSEATTLLGAITKHADALALGVFSTTEQIGYYRLAKSLTAPVSNLVLPLQTLAYNDLVAAHVSGGAKSMLRVTRRAVRTGVPLAVLLLVGIPLVPWILPILAGAEYREASMPAMILLAGIALALPTYWLRAYYLVLDKLRSWFQVSVLIGLTCVPAFAIGAAATGAAGVAVARSLVVTVVGNFALLVPLMGDLRRVRQP